MLGVSRHAETWREEQSLLVNPTENTLLQFESSIIYIILAETRPVERVKMHQFVWQDFHEFSLDGCWQESSDVSLYLFLTF